MSESETPSKPKKRYNDMTSKERFERFVERGGDPLDEDCGFCHDCGFFPAYKPRVMVANMATSEVDKYYLDLPQICDGCSEKRGLSRYGFLIPKHEEVCNFTGAIEAFQKRYPDWIKRVQERSIKDLMKQGMSEEDARGMMGYTK